MISNISIQSEDTAVAEGPRFDFDQILAAFEKILRGLIAEICLMCPGTRPTWRAPGIEDQPLLSDADFALLKAFFQIRAVDHEVVQTSVCVSAGPYSIMLEPFGPDQLYKDANADQPHLQTGEPWWTLDPIPTLRVMFNDAQGIIAAMNEGADMRDVLSKNPPSGGEGLAPCARRLAPDGALIRSEGWLEISFPHEVFGRGLGLLRIALLHVI